MKGQFVSITYGKECKVRKGRAPIHKFSKMTLRCGVEYDNIAAVQAVSYLQKIKVYHGAHTSLGYILISSNTKALYTFAFLPFLHPIG